LLFPNLLLGNENSQALSRKILVRIILFIDLDCQEIVAKPWPQSLLRVSFGLRPK
jgi:hypothetical protein